MKKFISFSGGVESTTMCLLYGEGATAIVCDTGDEEPEMYERWDFVEESMKIIHNGDFKLVRIKPFVNHKGLPYYTLRDLALAYGFFPGSGSRYCTRTLKIEPIDNYLKDQGECELMVGLNADEVELREGKSGTKKFFGINQAFPAGYQSVVNECEQEIAMYGLEQMKSMYKNIEEHKACGLFCHR